VAAYLQASRKELSEPLTRIRHIDVREAGEKGGDVKLVTIDGTKLHWRQMLQEGKIPLISVEKMLANLRLVLQGGKEPLKNRSYYLLWTTPLTAGPKKKAADNPK
jgi:hypothetical protein